jgi:hypothetical protein
MVVDMPRVRKVPPGGLLARRGGGIARQGR